MAILHILLVLLTISIPIGKELVTHSYDYPIFKHQSKDSLLDYNDIPTGSEDWPTLGGFYLPEKLQELDSSETEKLLKELEYLLEKDKQLQLSIRLKEWC